MKKKRTALVLTSILVIAVIAVGMTLALLQTTTGAKTNAFSSNKNIAIELREPKWDGYEFGDSEFGNGSTAKKEQENNMNLGVNQAKNYLPGQTIDKDPQIKNIGDKDGVDAYVALRVRYYSVAEDGEKTQITYDAFTKEYLVSTGIAFNGGWTKIQESTDSQKDQVFLYGTEDAATVLNEGEKTSTALFNDVKLSADLAPDEETGKLPQFAIEVQAFAIQSDNVEDVRATMLDFVNAN